ncbi:unnamed protein product [Rotaria sp. Silwood2]|nr:unnamed protein product [Rotaria sp. Silwood2]CAF3096615.1 unnamed protein product [Rotaria sp. Silwood2]CAF3140119.1 unnamed protein product [Rotaria sp. Silwood2]CAF3300432.1 unnamed protein product [Rotaria sp. Silwood2]CAF4181034.1 unnamed protein product [Rotaria sp. Silwood2]
MQELIVIVKGSIKDEAFGQHVWSIVDVEDEVHTDCIALRSMLIRTNLNDLRDVTHTIYYENYCYKKWQNITNVFKDERIEPETRVEEISRDMEAVHQSKVTEK